MELRGCSSHLHYIQVIKDGSIVKTMNVDRRGKPALVFKKVEDIYEAEDSKCFHLLPPCQPKDEFKGVFFVRDRFEIDSPCSSIEKGNSIKPDSETCEINCNAGDDQKDGDSDDLICVKMTLNQLKDMGRAKIDLNTCEINCNDGDDQRDSDLDVLNCDNITLNQLKDMVKNCSPSKEDNPNLQSMEDDIDLKVPLSCLKSKPSKMKKMCIKKCAYSSSQIATAISVKSEEVSSDQGFLHFIGYPCTSADIKIEILEPDHSDCRSVVSLADDSSVGFDKQVASNLKNNEMIETVDKSVLENGESFLFTEKRNCAVNEVSYDHLEHAEIVSLPDVTDISSETMNVDDAEIVGCQSLVLPLVFTEQSNCVVNEVSYDAEIVSLPDVTDISSETMNVNDAEINGRQSLVLPMKELNKQEDICHPPFHDISIPDVTDISETMNVDDAEINGHQSLVLAMKELDEQEDISHPPFHDISLPDVTDISSEIMNVDDAEHQSLVLPLKQLNEQEDISHPPFYDIYQEILYPAEDHNSSVYDSSHCYSIPHEISQQEKGSDEVQQSDNAIYSSIQCLPSNEGGVCVFGNEKDGFSCKLNTEGESSHMSNYNSPNESNPCLSPDSFLPHVNDDSPSVEKKQSPIYVGGYLTRKSSDGIQFCDTSNELSTLELAANCHHLELQHPPERLLSNRKAISPSSQEKLCKSMNAIDTHDDIKHYKCGEKLCFQKQTQSKASSEIEKSEVDVNAEGPEQTSRAEVNSNCKLFKRRPKNCSKGSRPKGILKVHQRSRSVPHFSTGRTSIQSCSQSAITFSQRQMKDIKRLATNLTKELNSMKDIVEYALQSEACLSTSLKYNSNEVKTAIGNARKVEETSKMWLFMMARDCKRFCNLMKLSEINNNTDSGNSISKKRKKITFADEAGGKLCHVKVFEEDSTAYSKS